MISPATPARIATLLAALALAAAAATPAAAKPLERRLHVDADAVEASSFLWNDSNKFLEDHHPNYVADDDPATAWVEGAKSSGAGEWLRINVWLNTTTQVRLRVRNGDQRSKDLWKANARAKAVTVRVLPGTTEEKVTLTDTDGWQEIVVDMPSGALRAVELAIDSVYEGTRSTDLAISDIQVFATSEMGDGPEHQKAKLAALTSWKRAGATAMKLFTARQARRSRRTWAR